MEDRSDLAAVVTFLRTYGASLFSEEARVRAEELVEGRKTEAHQARESVPEGGLTSKHRAQVQEGIDALNRGGSSTESGNGLDTGPR